MRLENGDAALTEQLSLGRLIVDARDLHQELVAALADLRSHEIERHILAVPAERIEPRVCVCVVAVEQRTVDVEEHSSDAGHASRRAADVPYAASSVTGTALAREAPMNAIDLLKQQHKKTKAALEKASQGKLDAKASKRAADELVAHMVIEEHVFYPRIRELMKEMVAESFEEHTVARFELARCLTARSDEQMKARFNVLKELVEHHVDEEEKEMLPKVQKALDEGELERLGDRMERMFESAVEAGLEALVTGATQDLRRPNGNDGASARKTPSRSMRAAR
jgi:hypothetical protein